MYNLGQSAVRALDTLNIGMNLAPLLAPPENYNLSLRVTTTSHSRITSYVTLTCIHAVGCTGRQLMKPRSLCNSVTEYRSSPSSDHRAR